VGLVGRPMVMGVFVEVDVMSALALMVMTLVGHRITSGRLTWTVNRTVTVVGTVTGTWSRTKDNWGLVTVVTWMLFV